MHEQVNIDATMQTKKKKSQTRWHKASIASTKEAKHVIKQMGELNMS